MFGGLPAGSVAGLRVFPNPVREVVNYTATSAIVETRLYDSAGRVVSSNRERILAGETAPLRVSGLPSGVYVLAVVTAGRDMLTRKVIKE